jgi:hypothetical protein
VAIHAAHYVQQVFGGLADSLGWSSPPGEDARQRSLRGALVLFAAVGGQDEKLQPQAREPASKWTADRSSVDPEVAGSVLVAAAHVGDQELFDRYAEASLADVLTSISACARRRGLQASSLREYLTTQ